MAYDYRETLRDDIREYIEDNREYIEAEVDINDREALEEYLNDTLWTDDGVTGNASGSYTFCRATAKEYVEANMDLAVEACREFDCIDKFAEAIRDEEFEYLDVTIRCYLLGEAIAEVLEEG